MFRRIYRDCFGIDLSNADLIFLANLISAGEPVEGVFGLNVPCAFLRALFSESTNLSVWPFDLGWYFLFFLQAGRAFSFCSTLNSCASVVEFFLWWQKLLIDWPHSLKRSIQSVPNRFSDCLWTETFTFLVVPFRVTGSVSSPSNFILSPVTARAVLFVFLIVGFFNFFHVCRLMIDRSEPESSCRSTFLCRMWTVTYFRRFFSVLIFDLACLTLFYVLYSYRVSLWGQFYHTRYKFCSCRNNLLTNVVHRIDCMDLWVISVFGLVVDSLLVSGRTFCFPCFSKGRTFSACSLSFWHTLFPIPRCFWSRFWRKLRVDSLRPVYVMVHFLTLTNSPSYLRIFCRDKTLNKYQAFKVIGW